MGGVSKRNRIAAILLGSNKPLTATQIVDKWPTKWVPNTNVVTGLLKTDKRFFQAGVTRELKRARNGVAVLWTHIDHKFIPLEEEE
tara:strand:- start:4527 stop:4784 length:258 start_codon:yes stop_codon:yes gene_type:complete